MDRVFHGPRSIAVAHLELALDVGRHRVMRRAQTGHIDSSIHRCDGEHRVKRSDKIVGAILATTLTALALAGCSSAMTGPGSADPSSGSTAPSQPANPDISPEQQALLTELLAEPLAVEEVQQRLDEQGYSSRVVQIDGEPRPATMDYRIDRVNLIVNDGLVTDAYWG